MEEQQNARRIDYKKLHGTFEERRGEIAKFNLMDDTFFAVVLEDNPAACEVILRILLDKPDLKVLRVRTQESLRNLYGHSATLDAMAVDSTGKRYDIEVQVRNEDDYAKRARFYQSVVDYKLSDKGTKYKDFPDLYIIFIAKFDLFQKKRNCYRIRRVVAQFESDETLLKQADNGVYEYYFSTKPELNQEDTSLAKLLQYFTDTKVENNDFQALSTSVQKQKGTEKGVGRMCELVERYAEDLAKQQFVAGKEAGRAEGEAKGRAEGEAKGKLEGLKQALANLIANGMEESQARKILGL